MRVRTQALFAALGITIAIDAQGTTVPADLNAFGLVCFCNSRVATPQYPISLDNNGRLLFAARRGTTREQLLAAGVPHNESQLRMLKDWGLLRERDKVLTTAFAILEPAAMAALRNRLRPIAAEALPKLAQHTAALKRELASRRQSEALYTLLFSYVLDGLVWERLSGSGKLPNQDITAEKPYWAGTFWAVFPKQDQMPGTNGRSSGRGELRMLWTPAVVDRINAFYGSKEAGDWIDAVNRGEANPKLFPGGARPVFVREEAGDPLFGPGAAMADVIAPAILAADLSAELPQADESQRLLIGTHELIWLLLEGLAAEQRIATPAVLSTGARATDDLAPLVIGVLNPDKP